MQSFSSVNRLQCFVPVFGVLFFINIIPKTCLPINSLSLYVFLSPLSVSVSQSVFLSVSLSFSLSLSLSLSHTVYFFCLPLLSFSFFLSVGFFLSQTLSLSLSLSLSQSVFLSPFISIVHRPPYVLWTRQRTEFMVFADWPTLCI